MKIPFISTPDKALTDTTQNLLPIADIVDGVVIYKNGGAAIIMESTSLNFGLLSEREQEAVIAAFAGLINSLSFSIQIVVSSVKKDISIYMTYLSEAEAKIQNPKLLRIMTDYKKFIEDAIKKKNVLSKKFYIVVPFSPLELGVKSGFSATFRTGGKNQALSFPKSYVIRKAKIALFPRRDHMIRQAARLALRVRHLNDDDLIRLFYTYYNPERPVKEKDLFGETK